MKKGATSPAPVYQENPVCVLTGTPWEITSTDDGVRWFARVVTPYGRLSTGLFQTRDQVCVFLSARGGVRPDSPNRVEVREPKIDTSAEDSAIKSEKRELNEAAVDFVAGMAIDGGHTR